MKKCDVVLDDNLYLIYHILKNGDAEVVKTLSIDCISKIMRFSGNSILTNIAQIDRLGLNVNDALKSRLLHQPARKHSLEELSKYTTYKVVLTDDFSKHHFPYVNINRDQIEMVMGGFVMKNQSRQKAISHLKSLCAAGREFIIYDKYFSAAGKEKSNIDLLKTILPQERNFRITYHKEGSANSHISDKGISLIKSEIPRCSIKDEILNEHHDRYIVIDNDIEIILTSGFDYLSNASKEISYIIRNYNNRLQ